MATANDLRRMALALEGTTEAPHFDRTAFKVARIYVTLSADGKTANFKFTPDEQDFKCMMLPEAFSRIPNAWGQQGWTAARLTGLSRADLEAAAKLFDDNGISHGTINDLGEYGLPVVVMSFRDPDNIQLELTAPKYLPKALVHLRRVL